MPLYFHPRRALSFEPDPMGAELYSAPVGRVPGRRRLITTGYLKASHRELDKEHSTQGDPYHPHTREVSAEPGTVEEYVLRIYPFAATSLPGYVGGSWRQL